MTAATLTADALPAPLAKLGRHPIRFIRNHAQLAFYAVLFAHIGMFIIVSLYYLLFETTSTMNNWWHTAVSDSNLRHAIRDVGEGVLGGMLAQAVVYNHFKKSNRKVGKLTGVLKRRLHIPQTLAALLASAILGAIFFAGGYYLLEAFHAHASSPDITGSVWHRTYESLWATDFPKKVLGLIAAWGARKPLRVVFANIQLWFVERKIDNGRRTHWFEPPPFQARYNAQLAHPDSRFINQTTLQKVLILGGSLVGLGLAVHGYYVLTYIA